MSLPAIDAARPVPFAIAAGEAAQASTSRISMTKLYRQYCKEEGCRVNSAFVNYVLDRGDTCAITTLKLCDNYLGPKGLRPVVRLIADCQTLVEVDLSGNGADNTTVDLLASVAERHLSLAVVALRDCPITVLGGKRLLGMLEANPRIVSVDVAGTDILAAMQERIAVAAELNRLRADQQTPQLVAAAVHGERAEEEQRAREGKAEERLAAYATRHGPATLEPASVRCPAVIAAPRPPLAGGSATQERVNDRTHEPREAHGGGPGRLPPAQLQALRTAFTERVKLFEDIHGSRASEAAHAARAELMAMEACGPAPASTTPPADTRSQPAQPQRERPAMAERVGGTAGRPPPPPATSITPASVRPPPPPSTGSPLGGSGRVLAVRMDRPASASAEGGEARYPVVESNENSVSGSTGAMAGAARGGEASRSPPPPPQAHPVEPDGAGGVGADTRAAPPEEESPAPGLAPGVLLVSTEERFQLLFDEGCRAYAHQDLDGAYVAWNAALDIATERQNREWMAVVSTNLQRLSYELLVKEGVQQLERKELEEAARSFTYAMEVAVKARNAAWESAMQRALRKVQSAVFHRNHEAATALFQKAVALREGSQRASADGSASRRARRSSPQARRHTQAFLDEWPSMLHMRDAVIKWGECVRMAARIAGAEGAALRRMVDDALTEAAAFLARHHLDSEVQVSGLGWQGTSRYRHEECVQLSELWRELLAHTDQTLKHPLLGVVVSLHLGNLYLATNQLSHASQQFVQAVRVSGQVLGDPVLEATAAMFNAILCWQRAMYAEAESQLLFAIRKCGEGEESGTQEVTGGKPTGRGGVAAAKGTTRSPAVSPDPFAATAAMATTPTPATTPSLSIASRSDGCRTPGVDDAGAGSAERSSGRSPLPRSAVPAGYLQVIRTGCNLLLVLTLVSTYRYREALERLEHGLTYQYCDTLAHKLHATYFSGGLTSLDEIAAISAQVRSTFVYYFPARRYQWNSEANVFAVEESLYTWVVPQSSEMRFVEVNVSKDFHCTVGELLDEVRAGLYVEPDHARPAGGGAAGEVITTLHRHAWMQPLQTLHAIFMDPIVDFIQAMSPLLSTSSSLVTVVPAGLVWAVPFHALMSASTDKFLVESIAVQLCFSATQAAFAGLNAQRVVKRDLHRDLVVAPAEEVEPEVTVGLPLAFPLDGLRGQAEGAEVMEALQRVKDTRTHAAALADPGATVMARSEVLVEDLVRLEELLPRARTAHIAMCATAAPPRTSRPAPSAPEGVSDGALCVPISHRAVGWLSAQQVSRMELFAELVVMSNTNVALPHVRCLSTRDHALNLARGFLSGGVPCVLAGLWCTPDMKPSALFTRFYQLLHTWGSGRVWTRKSVPNETGGSTVGNSMLGSGMNKGSAAGAGVVSSVGGSEVGEEGYRHKAVCLASAIRALLHEDPSLRYAPRQWAGYYCIGCDYL